MGRMILRGQTGNRMIVWGRSISDKVVATGQFYCPSCRQHRAYALRQPSNGALAIEIARRLGMQPEAVYATLAEFSARA